MDTALKKIMPSMVKSLADWFEIDFRIKLFGVTVFSFYFPPSAKSDDLSNSNSISHA